MAERTYTYFVSDVHLGLDVKGMKDRESRFVSFLNSIPKGTTESLYMLGDIWDFWYEYHDVVPKGYVRVFSALLALMDAGVKVYFFPGNHDIWCYHYFEEMGIKVIEQPYIVEIAGKTFFIGHGDGLGRGMRWYKLMRWAFHNRFLQVMFSFLHPWIAFRLGKGWSKNSRLAKSVPYKFRNEEEPLYKYAVEESSRKTVDYFIFGHYHDRVDLCLPTGARLLILKDWMDGGSYLRFSGVSGIVGYFPNIE